MNTKVTYESIITDAVNTETIYSKGSGSVASALFALAKSCNSSDDFSSGCATAEKWLKSEEAGAIRLVEGGRLPRCWVQAKSNIAAGLNQGLNPNDYKTASAFKKAKVEGNKAAEKVAEIGVKDALHSVTLQSDSPMSAPMAELVAIVAKLSNQQASKMIANWTSQAKSALNKHAQRNTSQRRAA
jgi:hypothetical protein